MLCVPTYSITKVDVVQNGTETRTVTPSPGGAQRQLDGISAWDMIKAHHAAYQNIAVLSTNAYTFLYAGHIFVDTDPYMNAAIWS